MKGVLNICFISDDGEEIYILKPQEITHLLWSGCQRKGIFTRVKIPFWHKEKGKGRGNKEKSAPSSARLPAF